MAIEYRGSNPHMTVRETRTYIFQNLNILITLETLPEKSFVEIIGRVEVDVRDDLDARFDYRLYDVTGDVRLPRITDGLIVSHPTPLNDASRLKLAELSVVKHLMKQADDKRVNQHILARMREIGGPKTGSLAFPKPEEKKQPTIEDTLNEIDERNY